MERGVGGPLEALVRTRRFADVLVVSFRVQGALLGAAERGTRTLVHLWNLPARSDVERVNRQVAALRAELRELSARLDEREERR